MGGDGLKMEAQATKDCTFCVISGLTGKYFALGAALPSNSIAGWNRGLTLIRANNRYPSREGRERLSIAQQLTCVSHATILAAWQK
jgi:hypothetical protein